MQEIKPGQIYKHYKGDTMKIIGVAKHSETLEDMVVYDHMGTNPLADLWVRPLEMFMGDAEHEGKMVKRFTYIEE